MIDLYPSREFWESSLEMPVDHWLPSFQNEEIRIIFPDKAEYKSNHVILDQNSFEHDLKDFYFVFIELPKFTKTKEDQLFLNSNHTDYFINYPRNFTSSFSTFTLR